MINRLGSIKKRSRPEITILSARPMNEVNFSDKITPKAPIQVPSETQSQSPEGQLQSSNENEPQRQQANIVEIDIPPSPRKKTPPEKPARKSRPITEIYANGFLSLRTTKTAFVDVDRMKQDSSKLGRSKSLYTKKSASNGQPPMKPAPPPPTSSYNHQLVEKKAAGSISPVRPAPSVPFASFNKKQQSEKLGDEQQIQSRSGKAKKKRSHSASRFDDRHKNFTGVRRSASTLPHQSAARTPDPVAVVTDSSSTEFIILGRQNSLDETVQSKVNLKSFGIAKTSKSNTDIPSNAMSNGTVLSGKQVSPTEVVPTELNEFGHAVCNSLESQQTCNDSKLLSNTHRELVTLHDAINASAVLARLKEVNEASTEVFEKSKQFNVENSKDITELRSCGILGKAVGNGSTMCSEKLDGNCREFSLDPSEDGRESRSSIQAIRRNNNERVSETTECRVTSTQCNNVTSSMQSRNATNSAVNASYVGNGKNRPPGNNSINIDSERDGGIGKREEVAKRVVSSSSPSLVPPQRPSPPTVKPKPKLGLRPWKSLDNATSTSRTSRDESTKIEHCSNAVKKMHPLIIKAGGSSTGKILEEQRFEEDVMHGLVSGENCVSNKESRDVHTISAGEQHCDVTQAKKSPLIIKATKSNKNNNRIVEDNVKANKNINLINSIDLRSVPSEERTKDLARAKIVGETDVGEGLLNDAERMVKSMHHQTSEKLDKPLRIGKDQVGGGQRSAAHRKTSTESEAESTGSVDSLSSSSSQATVVMNPNALASAIERTQTKPADLGPFDSKKSVKLSKKPAPEPYSSHRERRPKPGKQPPVVPAVKLKNRRSKLIGGRRPQISPPSTPPPPPKIFPENAVSPPKKADRPPLPPRAPSMITRNDASSHDALLKGDAVGAKGICITNKSASSVLTKAATVDLPRESRPENEESKIESETDANVKSGVSSKVEMFNKASEKPRRPPAIWKQKSLDTSPDDGQKHSHEAIAADKMRQEGMEALQSVSKLREMSTVGKRPGFTPRKPKRPLSFSMENFAVENYAQQNSEAGNHVDQGKKKPPSKPKRPLSFIKATSMDGGFFELNFNGVEIAKVKAEAGVKDVKEDGRVTEVTCNLTEVGDEVAATDLNATKECNSVAEASIKGTEISDNVGPNIETGQKPKAVPKKPVRTTSLRKKKPLVAPKRPEKPGQKLQDGKNGSQGSTGGDENEKSATSVGLSDQIEKLDEIITQTADLQRRLSLTRGGDKEPVTCEQVNRGEDSGDESHNKDTGKDSGIKATIDKSNGSTEELDEGNSKSVASTPNSTFVSEDSTSKEDSVVKTQSRHDGMPGSCDEVKDGSFRKTVLPAEAGDANAPSPRETLPSEISAMFSEVEDRLDQMIVEGEDNRLRRERISGKLTTEECGKMDIANTGNEGLEKHLEKARVGKMSGSSDASNNNVVHVSKTAVCGENKSAQETTHVGETSKQQSSGETVVLRENIAKSPPPVKPPRPLSFTKVRNTEYLFAFKEAAEGTRKPPPQRPTTLPITVHKQATSSNAVGEESKVVSEAAKADCRLQPSPAKTARPPIPALLRNMAGEDTDQLDSNGLMDRLKREMDITDPHCIALFDYKGDSAKDLSFKVSRDWLYGCLNEDKGLFPSSFVEVIIELPFKESSSEADDNVFEHIHKPHALALHSFVAGNDDELSFMSGDTIDLISKINDNWFQGACAGQIGIFPANFVAVVRPLSEVEPEEKVQSEREVSSECQQNLSGRICTAVVDYASDVDGDLSFKVGQDIRIISCVSTDWLKGVLQNVTGIFPRNTVKILDKLDD